MEKNYFKFYCFTNTVEILFHLAPALHCIQILLNLVKQVIHSYNSQSNSWQRDIKANTTDSFHDEYIFSFIKWSPCKWSESILESINKSTVYQPLRHLPLVKFNEKIVEVCCGHITFTRPFCTFLSFSTFLKGLIKSLHLQKMANYSKHSFSALLVVKPW